MKKIIFTLTFVCTCFFVFGQLNSYTFSGIGNSTYAGIYWEDPNLAGGNNSFFGAASGKNTTTGEKNTFIGAGAGEENTTGKLNTALGVFAGNKNTVGEKNTAIGVYAAYNTTGSRNTAVGAYAGNKNTTGGSNTFLGASAGYQNTTGKSNVYLGDKAGYQNTTGMSNVCVGDRAGYKNTTNGGNVFLGFMAGYNETGANKLYIANSNTATPLIHGDFGAAALTINGALTVTGDASKAGGGSWSVASDQRLKKDIHPFTDGLEVLQKINPVRFRYNGKANMPTDKEYVGIIAQDMQKIAPYTVATFTHKDKDGGETEYLDYDGSALDYIIVNAIKAQQEIITAQQKEIAGLKEMVYGLVSASQEALDTDASHTSDRGEE